MEAVEDEVKTAKGIERIPSRRSLHCRHNKIILLNDAQEKVNPGRGKMQRWETFQ
jgi:hypothetical protein